MYGRLFGGGETISKAFSFPKRFTFSCVGPAIGRKKHLALRRVAEKILFSPGTAVALDWHGLVSLLVFWRS